MALAQNYKDLIINEIYKFPEEYLPSIFQILQSIKIISAKKTTTDSPTERLLKLAGKLANPDKLSAKEFKKKVALEHSKLRISNKSTI